MASTQTETAKKFMFDLQSQKWIEETVRVKLVPQKIGEGGMRECYKLFEFDDQGSTECMAKFFKRDIRATKDDYFNEAMGQYIAEDFAQQYNKLPTPKKVAFVFVYVMELPGRRWCTVEPMLKGAYEKHNNNYGANFSNDKTAAAFSHFTYENSNRTMLVCDIQGVGEYYTDPQVHSMSDFNNNQFGMGNLGKEGIQRFLSTHTCNEICAKLALPKIQGRQAAQQLPVMRMGGMPAFGEMQGMPMMAAGGGLQNLGLPPQMLQLLQNMHTIRGGMNGMPQVRQIQPQVQPNVHDRPPAYAPRGNGEETQLNRAIAESLKETKPDEDELEKAIKMSLKENNAATLAQKQGGRSEDELLAIAMQKSLDEEAKAEEEQFRRAQAASVSSGSSNHINPAAQQYYQPRAQHQVLQHQVQHRPQGQFTPVYQQYRAGTQVQAVPVSSGSSGMVASPMHRVIPAGVSSGQQYGGQQYAGFTAQPVAQLPQLRSGGTAAYNQPLQRPARMYYAAPTAQHS